MTDEELMQAYSQGDMMAFQTLYQRHKQRIFGFIVNKLKNHSEAEEVFQLVFTKLHMTRKKYRQDMPYLPWIFTITRNALIDQIRKQEKYRKYIENYQESVKSDIRAAAPTTTIAINELPGLSETQRQALTLRFNQGLTFKEIGEYLQTSDDNSRQLISRAIRKLRKLLTEKETEYERY